MSKLRMVAVVAAALAVISAQSAWAGPSSSSSGRSSSVSSSSSSRSSSVSPYSARPSFSASSSSSSSSRATSYSARPSFSASPSTGSVSRPSYAASQSASVASPSSKAVITASRPTSPSVASTRVATQSGLSRSSERAASAVRPAASTLAERTTSGRTSAERTSGRLSYSQFTPKFQQRMRSQESGFRNKMQSEYAATTRTKSSSSIWGLLFLAWMLSDNAHKSDADMRALHAEVASLRQSMTSEELRYAQDISVQEGWNLPDDGIAGQGDGVAVQEYADVPPPVAAQEGPARPLQQAVAPIHELLGTDDPVEAMFKMAGYMAPLMFLFIMATVMRSVFRG